MRKIMIWAMMALLAVSCQKEDELPTFTALADHGWTNADLLGNHTCWNSTDQVKAFGNSGHVIYGVTPREDDPTCATLNAIENHEITGFLPYRFVYPASMAERGAVNNTTLYVTYPHARSISDAPLKYAAMYGESDHHDVAFRNLGGMLAIVLPAIDREVLQICVTADEPICGKYRINGDSGLQYVGDMDDDDRSVVVDAEGRTFAQGDCVYIAMPAGAYHNLSIAIYAADGTATKLGVPLNVQLSSVTPLNVRNLVFLDGSMPAATLRKSAFFNLKAISLVFHYNYTDSVPDAERIDNDSSNPESTPIYKKIIESVCHVYTPASKIYAPENSSNLFGSSGLLQNIDFGTGFNTSKVTDMRFMFKECCSLTSLDLSSFNTSNVTNMMYMFSDCEMLTSLDLSSFNTSNVTDMRNMFGNCKNLKDLNLSSFNTSNVTIASDMFSKSIKLRHLDLSSFSANSLNDFQYAFSGCTGLWSIEFSDSFTLSDSCDVERSLWDVGTHWTTTIKCNSQTRDRFLNGWSRPGDGIVWDVY